MESELSERYNAGLVPPPNLAGELAPTQVQHPAWQPTPALVEAARQQLSWNLAILALVVCVCLAGLALAWGWRP